MDALRQYQIISGPLRRLAITSLVAFVITLPVYADVAPAYSFAGSYKCSGTDPVQKGKYTNIPLTIKQTGETYQFNWDFGKQGGFILGTGIINKNVNSVIATVFWDSANPKSVGTITYQIQPDGSLTGSWTIPNAKLIGTEECKRTN